MSAQPAKLAMVSRGAIWSMIYLGTVRVGTFGVSVEVARLLGPVGTGAYGIALQVSGLATFVGAIGVGQALAQKLAQANHRARLSALTTTGFWIALVGSAFVGALLAFTSGPLARSAYRDASVATTLLWCGPLTLGGGLYLVAEGSLQGMRRFRALALWGVLVACADIGLGFAAAHLGIGFVYGARVLTRLVAAFVGLAVARRAIAHFDETSLAPGSATPVGDEMRTLFGFAGPAFVASAIAVLGQVLLRLLLVRASGLGPAGQYQVADTVGQGLMTVPLAASVAFLPAVARLSATEGASLAPSILRALKRVSGFSLPLCLGTMALGPIVLPAIFGPAYGPASPSLQVLALAYALAGVCSVLGTVALGRAELKTVICLNGLWLVVLWAVLAAGAARGGAQTSAAAVAVAYAVFVVVAVAIAVKRWRVPLRALLPPVLASSLLPGIVMAGLRSKALPAWLPVALALGAAVFVFHAWAWPEVALLLRGGGSPAAGDGAAA